MAQDRSAHLVCRVSDPFDASKVDDALHAIMAEDAILCTDGRQEYVHAAADLEVTHARIVARSEGRVRGPYHVQNVNGTHSAFKRWLKPFNGVFTARLPLYVAWLARITRIDGSSAALTAYWRGHCELDQHGIGKAPK